MKTEAELEYCLSLWLCFKLQFKRSDLKWEFCHIQSDMCFSASIKFMSADIINSCIRAVRTDTMPEIKLVFVQEHASIYCCGAGFQSLPFRTGGLGIHEIWIAGIGTGV